jgi:hypothetical protein
MIMLRERNRIPEVLFGDNPSSTQEYGILVVWLNNPFLP